MAREIEPLVSREDFELPLASPPQQPAWSSKARCCSAADHPISVNAVSCERPRPSWNCQRPSTNRMAGSPSCPPSSRKDAFRLAQGTAWGDTHATPAGRRCQVKLPPTNVFEANFTFESLTTRSEPALPRSNVSGNNLDDSYSPRETVSAPTSEATLRGNSVNAFGTTPFA
jgi:hypothetical protein